MAEKRAQMTDREEYIVSHIDEAISKGWLVLYFQPVIRTLSGKICSGEALARWIDPKLGMISPGEFVPVLEEHGLSYRLAEFVIDETAGLLSSADRMGMYPIPVSINLSRRDFEEMDPFEAVEQAVRKYSISRNLLCIEITESTAMENPELIRDSMDRFHQAGYEIWMDDFGSAYSSLNVLKDFDFDEIKLDMAFMHNFNDKAKKIVANCINMAKDIGVHTLCEGVETEEQVAFLRDHGCEKIQGFYYSRPCPLPELKKKIDDGRFSYELSVERFLYDDAGKIKLDPEAAGAALLSRNETLYPLQVSRPLREGMERAGFAPVKLRKPLEMEDTDFRQKLDIVVLNSEVSGEKEEVAYFLDGHYYVLTARTVARSNAGNICTVELRDITESARGLVLKDAGPVAQSVLNLYDCIYRTDLVDRRIDVILSSFSGEMAGKSFRYDPESMSAFIYWKDRERFRVWIDPERMIRELWEHGKKNVSDIFRIERPDGTRVWELFTLFREEGKGAHEAILCMKPSLYSDPGMTRSTENMLLNGAFAEEEKEPQHRTAFTPEAGWNALMEQDALKVFWKDRERRFAGASRSFLDYFGLDSADQVIGKTDEECRWHIDNRIYEDAEKNILRTGQELADVPGKVIVNGSIRNIVISEFPLYHGGEIAGLAGVFIDVNDVRKNSGAGSGTDSSKTDPDTGTMRFSAWFAELAGYEDRYNRMDQDYWIGVLTVHNYWKIHHEFGQRTAEETAKIVADTIRSEIPGGCVIGRADRGTFVIVTGDPDSDLGERLKRVSDILAGTHFIGAYSGMISSYFAVSERSETSNPFRAVGLALEMAEKSRVLRDSRNERSTRGTGASSEPEKPEILTLSQVRRKMDALLEVFDFVRLSDPEERKIIRFDRDGTERVQNGNCFDIWGTGVPCDNCISARTFSTKEGLTKFETDGENIYIVTSRYVNVEGRPCVMEMVLRMNDSSSLGSDERGVFIRTLSNCRARVYEDSMTGIHNRRYYEHLMARHEVDAIAVIDIDNVKDVNLAYGHIAGDNVIRRVAEEIASCVRYRDLVRYDGDRFLIEFSEEEGADLEGKLRAILDRISGIRFDSYPELKVTATACGVPRRGRVSELLADADRVLSETERTGSGICVMI